MKRFLLNPSVNTHIVMYFDPHKPRKNTHDQMILGPLKSVLIGDYDKEDWSKIKDTQTIPFLAIEDVRRGHSLRDRLIYKDGVDFTEKEKLDFNEKLQQEMTDYGLASVDRIAGEAASSLIRFAVRNGENINDASKFEIGITAHEGKEGEVNGKTVKSPERDFGTRIYKV